MWFGKYQHFCDIHPFFYAISFRKELLKRHLRNLFSREKIARTIQQQKLPHVVFTYSSNLIKRGRGIDPVLQYNKADKRRRLNDANCIVYYVGGALYMQLLALLTMTIDSQG